MERFLLMVIVIFAVLLNCLVASMSTIKHSDIQSVRIERMHDPLSGDDGF